MKQEALGIENLLFAEALFESWKEKKTSVPSEWDELFSHISDGAGLASTLRSDSPPRVADAESAHVYKQSRIDSLIWAYRDVGYLHADLNPLQGYITPDLKYLFKTIEGSHENLRPEDFGLEEADRDTIFRSGRSLTPPSGTLEIILSSLRETYCSYMGVEVFHIQNRTMRGWLIEKIEQQNNRPVVSNTQKMRILSDVIKAEELESFIHSNYIGQKRFSLEGGESLIPALHHLIDIGARDLGIQEIVLGMAHRGRLNVLTNLMNKPQEEVFSTFEDRALPYEVGGSGDVKYHLGFSTDHINEDGSRTHVSLLPNPSHLESVGPVVEGKARGAQRRRDDNHRKRVIPVLIHGDSAFTGQGVVAETFNLAQLRGYKTGGTIHIIINNQIGFTTAPRDSRSTFFCTDVAKVMPVPIFHVNGDHPEHVTRAIDLAVRFRQKFGYDAVVDIICYRKYGHNEADEPSFTHPIMYGLIENADSVSKIYGRQMDEEGVCSTEEQKKIRDAYRSLLKLSLKNAKSKPVKYITDGFQFGDWKKYKKEYSHKKTKTGVALPTLKDIGKKLTTVPQGFQIHRKLQRILDDKKKMLAGESGFDWATAEALSFASLLIDGTPIRLSGEDSGRGTFSQRHAVCWNIATETPEPYIPLTNLSEFQARFRVYDSPLSEFSVLGFEYGNAMAEPEMLTLWEAQFGDFCNGAQVIIDQFIAAGESKWDRGNGLVLLLPHGYEGQGPEHSSGHLERFLQLCADDNIQVCVPTTPAQYFHLLRRQMKRDFRKPLIVMTPKSLLRSKDAVSAFEDMANGGFSEVLNDPLDPQSARVLAFCSGKIYYDLATRRNELKAKEIAIIRLEQLHPFPAEQVKAVVKQYSSVDRYVWVQEEPRNRGAWYYIENFKHALVGDAEVHYAGRQPSASPATGSYQQHRMELNDILASVFCGSVA